MLRLIKADSDYDAALAEIERLLDLKPPPGTPEGEELELLILLVQDYESKKFTLPVPDPVDAILFRMEQENLSQRDLVPFIGSRSKVSEVLSRKRPLTLSMIRALHSGLGIPAKVLLQGASVSKLEEAPVQWERFPLREMIKRGWIKEGVTDLRSQAEHVLRDFFAGLGPAASTIVFYKHAHHVRSARPMDIYALSAWTARVVLRAREALPQSEYRPGVIDLQLMREIARLSVFEKGPLLAREYLAKHGISLVIEPHLPGTHLDGAAVMIQLKKPQIRPVIGLTLRYDRIDNFWFCLMHELAHVCLHAGSEPSEFYDDLDAGNEGDVQEKEADEFGGEALIPEEEWRRSPASRLRSPEAVKQLAAKLRIHPAIIAGRIRYHFKSYRVLNQQVGHGLVRRVFPEVNWL